ncbi:MAG: hypothetical protein RLZZ416_724 [Candidatus Parcubacteria bacterium]
MLGHLSQKFRLGLALLEPVFVGNKIRELVRLALRITRDYRETERRFVEQHAKDADGMRQQAQDIETRGFEFRFQSQGMGIESLALIFKECPAALLFPVLEPEERGNSRT